MLGSGITTVVTTNCYETDLRFWDDSISTFQGCQLFSKISCAESYSYSEFFVYILGIATDKYLDFLIRHDNFKKFNKHVDLEMLIE